MKLQGRDRTDETTIAALMAWLGDLYEFPPEIPAREGGRVGLAPVQARRHGAERKKGAEI